VLKITGYSDKISVRSGDEIHFYINSEESHYEAQLIRIRCGDLNPEGPGLKEEEIDAGINGRYPGRTQQIHAGSYGYIPPLSHSQRVLLSEHSDRFCFVVYIYPTALTRGEQYIFDYYDPVTKQGFCLKTSQQGLLTACISEAELTARRPLIDKVWYRITLSYFEGKCLLVQQPLDKFHQYLHDSISANSAEKINYPERPILIGGCFSQNAAVKKTWNGKVDNPTIYETIALDKPLIQWDFSIGIPTIEIIDQGMLKLNGYLVNMPTRGVTGHLYDGEAVSWQNHPEQYSAVYFHDDDLYDAKWDHDFVYQIPEDLKSGLYAVRLRISDQDEYIPFVIRASINHAKNELALLFPTATYMAYANEHPIIDAPIAELIVQRALQITPHQAFLNEHREYGSSLYDSHSDGSGVHYSSRLRPMLNMRPKRLFSFGAGSSFLWQFNADTHIIDWLEEKSIKYDMITDEDIDLEGFQAIKDYRVIMTTTHPEYYSTHMLKALEDYLDNGGRLIYMGGNGFYWRIAFHKTQPGIIEVRRAAGAGTRAWETASGESAHSFTGEMGGLWRHQNRSPNKLCGVGFAAQGFDHSSYYRRTAEANNLRASFIFEGVTDQILGDFGLIGGGAAGMEIDRYDSSLGSPRHALVLASSETHTAAHVVAVEDIFNNYLGTDGEQNSLVRADMTFFETPAGGAVFSTGSISWSASLSHDHYKNNISQITHNVVSRFISPERFVYPHDQTNERSNEDDDNIHVQVGC
jgi:N,N-dimethylformamidase